jgi:hypothetical protein
MLAIDYACRQPHGGSERIAADTYAAEPVA